MELPQNSGSEAGLIERFAAALAPEAPVQEQTAESSQAPEQETQELPPQAEEVVEEAPEADPEEGYVDLTLEDGRTYKVPQELKNEFMHKSDYTRKTQELSILQKQATEALQQQALQAHFQQAIAPDLTKLQQLKSQAEQLRTADRSGWDTDMSVRALLALQQVEGEAKELEAKIGQASAQFQQHVAQKHAEQTRNAYDYIGRHVRDWKPDSKTEQEVADYANNYGVTPDALGRIANLYPGFAVMAYKAQQFDKLQSTKGQAVQKAQAAPPVVKPGAVTQSNTLKARAVKQARENVRKTGTVDALQQYLLVKGIK